MLGSGVRGGVLRKVECGGGVVGVRVLDWLKEGGREKVWV